MMVKQISLDSWQVKHLGDLLRRGAEAAIKTNSPIVLYRQTVEEEGDSYEELVCTLTETHVVEQLIVSGGMLPPTFHRQEVFGLDEYPKRLLQSSRDRFLQVVGLLEERLG